MTPCNGCTLCCQADTRPDALTRHIPLTEGELGRFVHESGRSPSGYIIARKGDGSCWYLSSHGCEVHEDKPIKCWEFDCRKFASQFTRSQARDRAARYGKLLYRVWQKGISLSREVPWKSDAESVTSGDTKRVST